MDWSNFCSLDFLQLDYIFRNETLLDQIEGMFTVLWVHGLLV